ncbi:MAG: hypothetical protein VKL59_20665 [Nostocaceae cyanobacterium]|nr:hypothetical protein [Nostocaceae cyanobacterium]
MSHVNGTWLGTYWQDGIPTRFEAVVIQSGNSLSGSILDDSYLGEARLSGEVIGRGISFTKRYLTSSPEPIRYVGTISEDENLMQGQWNIGRGYSGTWEAHRSGETLMADLQTQTTEQVPSTMGIN